MYISKIKAVALLTSILLLSGCVGPRKAQLNSESKEVVLSSAPPEANCKRLDLVTYSYFKGTFFSCDFTDAQNTLKNQAAKLGGNYVKLLGITDAGTHCQGSGEAYSCPNN